MNNLLIVQLFLQYFEKIGSFFFPVADSLCKWYIKYIENVCYLKTQGSTDFKPCGRLQMVMVGRRCESGLTTTISSRNAEKALPSTGVTPSSLRSRGCDQIACGNSVFCPWFFIFPVAASLLPTSPFPWKLSKVTTLILHGFTCCAIHLNAWNECRLLSSQHDPTHAKAAQSLLIVTCAKGEGNTALHT